MLLSSNRLLAKGYFYNYGLDYALERKLRPTKKASGGLSGPESRNVTAGQGSVEKVQRKGNRNPRMRLCFVTVCRICCIDR